MLVITQQQFGCTLILYPITLKLLLSIIIKDLLPGNSKNPTSSLEPSPLLNECFQATEYLLTATYKSLHFNTVIILLTYTRGIDPAPSGTRVGTYFPTNR